MLKKRICAACLCLSLLLGTAPAAYGAEMEPDEVPAEAAEAERTEVPETSTEAEALEAPTTEPVETVPEAPEEPEALEDSKETEKPEMVGAGTEAGEPAEQTEYPINDANQVVYPVEGGNLYFDRWTGTLETSSWGITSAVIPSSINGVAVTHISSRAFESRGTLRSVTISYGVTSIGGSAFRKCESLQSLKIPSSLTGIGKYAFEDCCELKSAGPTGGGYNIEFGWTEAIPSRAFGYLPNLTSVVLPNSITSIGEYAFEYCGLNKIVLPNSLTSIGERAFSSCRRLRDIMLPAGLTSIGAGAFEGCTSLKSLVIPAGVNMTTEDHLGLHGQLPFRNCAFESAGPIGGGYDLEFGWTEAIPDGAFGGLSNLTSVVLPDSVTSLGDYAFSDCGKLSEIALPAGLTSFGSNVFADCGFTSVTLPVGVTEISDNMFRRCTSLTSITIPDSVTSIEYGAFAVCTNLADIAIPDSVATIGAGAFDGCTGFTNIVIPDGVTSIEETAFSGCTGLTEINLPAGITSIETYTFRSCTSLKTITIPTSVTSIGYGAFAYCIGLAKIELPAGVTNIGGEAFIDCTALESAAIPAGVSEIPEKAFSNCSKLVAVTIPVKTRSIMDGAFSGCSGLRDIFYGGSDEQWKSVYIRGNNDPLKKAALRTLSTNSFVAILGTWNPTLDQVTFSNIMSLTTPYYKVTSQSATPSEGLAASVGRYVLAEVSGDEIVSIQPVESRLGRLEALSSESLTLDGTRYPSQVDISKYAGTLGDLVVCHLWGGQAVGLQVPAEKTGKLASWDGSTVSGLGGTAVIDKSAYPTGSITDLSFLGSVTRLLGRTVRYWTLDGKLLRMEKEDERWTESKRFQRYDRASGTVFFQDGTSRRTAEGLTVPSLTAGRWVICEVEDSQETGGARITAMRAIEPHVTVNVVLSGGPVEYRSGKLRFVGGQYVGKTSFEIPVRVEVSNDSSVPGQLTGAVREDKSLWMTVNKVTLTAPDGFNFGWLGGGAVELDSPVTLAPGEAWSGQGYLRANASFSPKSPDSRYALQAVAETSAGTRAAGANLRVLIPGKEPSDETRKLAVNAARLLDETSSRVNILLPDAEKMLRDLGIEGDSLDTFSKLLLTEIIMSGAPEETFQEHVNRETLEKLFKYKPDLGVDHYTLPLTFVVDTEKYGRVTLRVNCDVSNFTLSGDRYALSAQVDYQILSSEKDCPWKEGRVGQVFDADVDSYAKAAYDVAEAEIKNQYNKVWGNGADAVCDLIFGSSVTAILKEHDTTYKDEIWKLATWPSKSLRVSQKSAGNKRLALSSPIGVYVYDEAGQLRGVMEQYQVLKCDGDFTLRADGGDICIDGLAEGYTVRYAVSENVEAEVAVTELAGYGSPLREVVFSGLSLDAGKQYTQTVSAALLPDKDSYRLSEDGGAALAEGREQMLVTLRPAAAGTLESAVLESGGVRVSYTAERGRLIAAAYRADGKLLDVSAASLDGSGSVRVKLNTAGASYVTAALADQESWRPLCPNLRIPAGG